MKCCRVVGPMWAAAKHPAFAGRTLFIVQPLDEHGQEAGQSFVAIDHVQAGIGDKVIVLTDHLVPFPCIPWEIQGQNVDFVVVVDRVGDASKIVSVRSGAKSKMYAFCFWNTTPARSKVQGFWARNAACMYWALPLRRGPMLSHRCATC